MIERGVIATSGRPTSCALFCPLYVRFGDVWDAAEILAGCIRDEVWREPRFNRVLASPDQSNHGHAAGPAWVTHRPVPARPGGIFGQRAAAMPRRSRLPGLPPRCEFSLVDHKVHAAGAGVDRMRSPFLTSASGPPTKDSGET